MQRQLRLHLRYVCCCILTQTEDPALQASDAFQQRQGGPALPLMAVLRKASLLLHAAADGDKCTSECVGLAKWSAGTCTNKNCDCT